MMQNDKPLIAIVGATRKQGRSVATTLLQSQRFRVRALTRNDRSPAARALQDLGAEIVRVTLEIGRTKELVVAFEGATGAFLMTPPVAPPDRSKAPLGRQLADAAVVAGVRHIVDCVALLRGGSRSVAVIGIKARLHTLPLA
ncbi:hypothetical protein EPK99_03225 [Neorhizobium lilium]|uniref:NmrA-like domain-containing protein n=1 Tax=Neorhizobium lilium TaxID=2503024 RepID=A0A444LLW1_9HYPH|nr:hypothetical protein EPK99_03225 [Neorhizobium lilium]